MSDGETETAQVGTPFAGTLEWRIRGPNFHIVQRDGNTTFYYDGVVINTYQMSGTWTSQGNAMGGNWTARAE